MEQKQQKKLFRRIYERSRNALKKTILGTTVALGIGAAAIACGGRPGVCDNGSPICYPAGQDGGVLQQDARTQNDAVQFDSKPPQSDGGVDGPVPPQFSYTLNNLIGDYLNRDLLDRDRGAKDYPLIAPETDPNANPFSDGNGGSLGVDKTAMTRVDNTMFHPFMTSTLTDEAAAKSYTGQPDLWLGGSNHYSDVENTVVGNIDFVAYTMKFKGADDDFGIPVCTSPTGTDYTTCKGGGMDYNYATESHKIFFGFAGEQWILSEMLNPTTTLTSENLLVRGGHVRLAQEDASGILNQNGYLPVDDLIFKFDGLENSGGITRALFSVREWNDNILKRDTITPGETKNVFVNGKSYLFHCYKVAPDYPMGTIWADVALLSKELKLMDGQKLDPDNDNNKYVKVFLGWKNKGASVNDTIPDHLRTIILYADDIASLSSGGRAEMLPGDYIPLVQDPVNFTLTYKGLSATPSTYSELKFNLEKNINRTISSTEGPYDSNGQRVSCTINAPHVEVTSSVSGATFTVDGVKGLTPTGTVSASDNVFVVATNGANCGGSIGTLTKGSLFMRPSPSSDSQWVYLDYAPFYNVGSVLVKFPLAGDGVSDAFRGSITYAYVRDYAPDMPTDFEFNINEKSGTGVSSISADYIGFGLRLNSAATFNFDAPGVGGVGYWYKTDTARYCWSGPVSPSGCSYPIPGSFIEEGTITERGSKFTSITDTSVTFDIAGELVYSQFVLAKK